jgi:hypothetical protein
VASSHVRDAAFDVPILQPPLVDRDASLSPTSSDLLLCVYDPTGPQPRRDRARCAGRTFFVLGYGLQVRLEKLRWGSEDLAPIKGSKGGNRKRHSLESKWDGWSDRSVAALKLLLVYDSLS